MYLKTKTKYEEGNYNYNYNNYKYQEVMGYAVAQLIEALRYKPEGRGFDPQWCHWNVSLT